MLAMDSAGIPGAIGNTRATLANAAPRQNFVELAMVVAGEIDDPVAPVTVRAIRIAAITASDPVLQRSSARCP